MLCWEWLPSASAQQREPRSRRRGSAAIDAAMAAPVDEQMSQLREGAVLTNKLGAFLTMGERIAFKPEGEQYSFGVLENLALERVWKMLDATRGRQWIVSGTVTEYRGRNYLLMDRAVLRARVELETAEP
jgi:hypothetical protein